MLDESEILFQVESVLLSLLKLVPFVGDVELKQEVRLSDVKRADFIAAINIENKELKLVGEVKRNLQPRYVLDAIRQVKEYCYLVSEPAYPVVVSDYISPRSAEMLINENVSYFDLVGNCRLCFANVYIEKEGKKSKGLEKRGIKSLFALKSSRMLRLMLNNPVRTWQIKELSAKTELSFGQVSNIRRALLDQHYAIELEAGGFCINQPAALLSEWSRNYKKNVSNRAGGFYSMLKPEDRLDAVRKAIAEANEKNAGIILGGLSAARWQAPFSKSMSEIFYADKEGIEILKKHLMLESVKVGPNVIIEEPKDPFIFKEATECAPGLKCTNVIQTYLDLYIAGEREREAAEHIELHILKERWSNKIKDVI
jgi:hypothetical protein